MHSFRPISHLNTDYKNIAHILASRLQKVLPEIISTDQSDCLKGTFIGHNIRRIIDTIQHAILRKQQAYLLFLDFENTFNKLNHNFLIKLMLFISLVSKKVLFNGEKFYTLIFKLENLMVKLNFY